MSKKIITIFFAYSALCLPQFAGAAIVSNVSYEGGCIALPAPQTPNSSPASPAGIGTAITTLVATSAVKSTLSFASEWLASYGDSFKGADTASSLGAFYCLDANGKTGHREYLSYARVSLVKNKKSKNIEAKTLISLKSKVNVFLQDGETGNGIFTITPHVLNYAHPIAKRGSTKDLTITYAFEIFDDKGEVKSLAVAPIVIKSVKKGDSFDDLSSYIGAALVGPVPSNTELVSSLGGQLISAPFKMTVTLAETSEGNGVKLAGKIAKELSDSIDEGKDDLAKKIIDALVDKNDDASDDGGNEEEVQSGQN